MEEWEIKLREKLEKEIPHGSYKIGLDPIVVYTGKGGYIDYLVAFERLGRKMEEEFISPGNGIMDQIVGCTSYKKDFTIEDYKKSFPL